MSTCDTRILLLDTALDLIWHSNYNSVGVNEICKQAGVTKGAFYHHFESKAELFCEATNHHWGKIKKDLDALLSPDSNPLEQLENWLDFIFINKIGEDANNIPGCAFFSAANQTGCGEEKVTEAIQTMSRRSAKYNLALVHALQQGKYLQEGVNAEVVARLLQQYVHGAISYARVMRDISNIKRDIPEGVYRLIGLKPEYWFSVKPNWAPSTTN